MKNLTEADIEKIFRRMTDKVLYDILRQQANNIRTARVISVDTRSSTCSVSITGTGKIMNAVKYPTGQTSPSIGDFCVVLSQDSNVASQNFIISTFGNKNKLLPGFSAYKGGAQTFGVGFTKVNCDKETFDLTGDFDTSTYTFTASVRGEYFFSGNINAQSIPNAARYIASIYKNGAEAIRGADISAGNTADAGTVVAGELILNIGDTVDLYTYMSSSVSSLTAPQYNRFSGHLVKEII